MTTGGPDQNLESVRLDLWLWAARFYKTRRLATDEIKNGRISVNGCKAKAARPIKPNDRILIQKGQYQFDVAVIALSDKRGPASAAQQLYKETQDSQLARQELSAERRWQPVPAPEGRPDRRDRRKLRELTGRD